jgi:hypothetical protein
MSDEARLGTRHVLVKLYHEREALRDGLHGVWLMKTGATSAAIGWRAAGLDDGMTSPYFAGL